MKVKSTVICLALILFVAFYALPQNNYKKIKIEYSDGMSAFKQRNYTKAQKHFKKLTELRSDYAYAYFMLGLCSMKQNDRSSAIEFFRKAEKKGKKDSDLYLNLGNAYYYEGDKNRALKEINKIDESKLSSDKNRYNFHFYRGRIYLAMKAYNNAISDMREAISLKSSATSARKMLGQAYYANRNYSEAVDVLKKVLSKEPAHKESLSYLSRAYINLAKRAKSSGQKERYYSSAIRYARKLVETAGDSFESHNILARSLLGAGKHRKSISSFKKALKYKPEHCYARFNLGQSYYAVKKYSSALTTLKKASRCMNGEALVWFYIGKTYDKQGKLREAKKAFQKASRMGNSKADNEVKRVAAKIQNKEVKEEKRQLEKEREEARRHREEVKRQVSFSEMSMEIMEAGKQTYVYIFGTATNNSSEILATLTVGIDFLKNGNKIYSDVYKISNLEKGKSKSIEYDTPLSEMNKKPDDYRIYAEKVVFGVSQ